MFVINRSGRTSYLAKPIFEKNQKITNPIKKQEQNQQSKKHLGLLKKLYIGAAGVVTGIGIFLMSKCKTNKKLLSEIPQDLQIRFAKLKNLNGKEFVDKAYTEMVEYMNLQGIAPKNIKRIGTNDPISINGSFHPTNNTIEFTDGFFTILPKPEQINLMSHELKHCEQFTNMLRTEGIGLEGYVKATVESTLNNAKNNPMNVPFSMAYNRAKSAGTEEEFLDKIRKDWTKEANELVKENFKDVLAMPKIKADSPEGIKAVKDLKAKEEYVGLNFLGIDGEKYKNNPLEVEAYSFGSKIEKLYEKYLKATK